MKENLPFVATWMDLVNIKDLEGNSVQFSPSVMSDSLWLHELQRIGFPVHHQLPELAQTQVHGVSDVIQSTHPLSSPSPTSFNWKAEQNEMSRSQGQILHDSSSTKT